MKKALSKSALSSIILNIFILLTIFVPGHMYDWGVERIFVVFIALLGSCCLIFNKKLKSWLKISPSLIIVISMSLTIVGILGYSSTVIVYAIDTGIRDYFEILRWPIYMIFILFVARFFSKQHIEVFNKAIIASLLYCSFVFVLYKVNVPVLSSFFTGIIYHDAKTWFTLDGYGRLSVPFENPNFYIFNIFYRIIKIEEIYFINTGCILTLSNRIQIWMDLHFCHNIHLGFVGF